MGASKSGETLNLIKAVTESEVTILNLAASAPEEIVTVNKLDAIYVNISKIETPYSETDRKHFEYLKAALNGAKVRLDKIEKRIETITTK